MLMYLVYCESLVYTFINVSLNSAATTTTTNNSINKSNDSINNKSNNNNKTRRRKVEGAKNDLSFIRGDNVPILWTNVIIIKTSLLESTLNRCFFFLSLSFVYQRYIIWHRIGPVHFQEKPIFSPWERSVIISSTIISSTTTDWIAIAI